MKLWILRPQENLPADDDPWIPWYDKCFGMVIRAKNEETARARAHGVSGSERHEHENVAPWLEEKYSSCKELTGRGDEEVILLDYRIA